MKNRFLVNAGENYYPDRNNIVGAADTLEDARKILYVVDHGFGKAYYLADEHKPRPGHLHYDWAYILDVLTLEEIKF